MNFQAVEQANGNNVTIFGTFTEIGGVQYTPQSKAKAICKIRDTTGVAHNVHIYQGKGQLPTPEQLNQRHQFSLSTFQGSYRNKPYTGYSGFWQPQAQVNQPAPQQGQQPAPQPSQSTNDNEMVRIRSMAVEYAKDLVCAKNMQRQLLPDMADEFTAYIMTGKWVSKLASQGGQPNPDWVGDDPPPPPDDGIPY